MATDATPAMADGEVRDRPVRSRRWVATEDVLLRRAVAAVPQGTPRRWRRVAEQLPERTPKQCRSRWTEYLDPVRESRAWTDDETQQLLFFVRTVGRAWSALVPRFRGRTANDLKNEFARASKACRTPLSLPGLAAAESATLSTVAPFLSANVTLSTSLPLPLACAEPRAAEPALRTDAVWIRMSFAEPSSRRRFALTEDMWERRGVTKKTAAGRRSARRRTGAPA